MQEPNRRDAAWIVAVLDQLKAQVTAQGRKLREQDAEIGVLRMALQVVLDRQIDQLCERPLDDRAA